MTALLTVKYSMSYGGGGGGGGVNSEMPLFLLFRNSYFKRLEF